MARDRRSPNDNRPQMDYYEYRRQRDAGAPDRQEREQPQKRSIFKGLKDTVSGFGAREGDEPVLDADDLTPQAEAPIADIEAPAAPAEAPIADIEAPVAPVEAPIAAIEAPVSDVAPPIDVDEPLDVVDVAGALPSAVPADDYAALDEDEDDELDQRANNPFSETIEGVKKFGARIRQLGGSIRNRVGKKAEDDEAMDDQDRSPYARPESGDSAADDQPAALHADEDERADDASDDRPDKGKRKWFSFLGSPGAASANEDSDDDDDDIAPSGGRVKLFGRGEEDEDEGIEDDDRATLTRQLAEALDAEAPMSRRERRLAAEGQYAREEDDEQDIEDEPQDMADEPQDVADEPQDDRAIDLDDVDEPTQAFKPLRREVEGDDDQSTRKFRPVRVRKDEYADEDDLGAYDLDDEADDEDEDDEPPRRRRFGLGRRKRQARDTDDDDSADEDDDQPPVKRRSPFAQLASEVPDDEDDDDYESDDDLPVRRYGGKRRGGASRIYEDDDYDDYDDDYDDEYDEYDEYDEDEPPLGFGKRLLRFIKWVLVIVIILLLAVITMRLLEASHVMSFDSLRSFGPMNAILPAPVETPSGMPSEPSAEPSPSVGAGIDAPVGNVSSGELTPFETPAPTDAYMGVSIDDEPSATATAEFLDEDDELEAVQ